MSQDEDRSYFTQLVCTLIVCGTILATIATITVGACWCCYHNRRALLDRGYILHEDGWWLSPDGRMTMQP